MLKLLLSLTLATLFISSSSLQNGPKVRRLLGNGDDDDEDGHPIGRGKAARRAAERAASVQFPKYLTGKPQKHGMELTEKASRVGLPPSPITRPDTDPEEKHEQKDPAPATK